MKDTDLKVGDVIDYSGDGRPFLVLKLKPHSKQYVGFGFYQLSEEMGHSKKYDMSNLSRGWKIKLITDQSVINKINDEYRIFQLCEIIEK